MVSGSGDLHPLPGLQGEKCVVGTLGFRPENANLGIDGLGDDRAAGEQPAAAHRRDQRVQMRNLFEQFERRRPLPCHDQRMIEGRNQRGAGLFENLRRDGLAAFRGAGRR